jgi:hypothetical protein
MAEGLSDARFFGPFGGLILHMGGDAIYVEGAHMGAASNFWNTEYRIFCGGFCHADDSAAGGRVCSSPPPPPKKKDIEQKKGISWLL